MIRRILLGAIPTLVVGFAVLTLNAKQPSGIALNQVKHTTAKSNGQTKPKRRPVQRDKAKATQSKATQENLGYYRGYHGYRGYHSYYGYRGYSAQSEE